MKAIIRFLQLLLSGIIAGTLFGIYAGYDPHSLTASTYVEQQQAVIRSLNVLMPFLGLATILLTLLIAFLNNGRSALMVMFVAAAAFLIVSGLITRFGNQPINSIMMTWNPTKPPSEWIALRDKWWQFHKLRTLTAILSFCISLSANGKKQLP